MPLDSAARALAALRSSSWYRATRATLASSPRSRRVRHPAVWGTLRRTEPLDLPGRRGLSVYDHLVDEFGAAHMPPVDGPVLVDADRTRPFIGRPADAIVAADPHTQTATIIGDPADPGVLEPGRYAAVVLTESVRGGPALDAIVTHAWAALRPGGTMVLATPASAGAAPPRFGIPPCEGYATAAGLRRIGATLDPAPAHLTVTARGGLVTAMAHLLGAAADELSAAELARDDPRYPVVVLLCATHPDAG